MDILEEQKIIGELNLTEEPNVKPEYKYIAVVFEDNLEKGKFRGNSYNYKTLRDLKEGQVIKVPTRFGTSKACVTNANVDVNTITFDLDLIKEV